MPTFPSVTNPQSETKKLRETKFDAFKTGKVKFFPFVMTNLKELNLAVNEKHDLSKNKEGYLLHSRQITYEEMLPVTGKQFADSICPDKTKKAQECFVFVPGWSDYLPPISVEEVQLFHILRKFLNDENFTFGVSYPGASNVEGKILKIVQNQFSGVGSLSAENRARLFMQEVENKIMSSYSFYDSRASAVSSISLCEIRWHSDPSLGYGKFVKYKGRSDLSEIASISALEQIIKTAKSGSNLPPKSVSDSSAKELLATLEAIMPESGQSPLYPNPTTAKQMLANLDYAEQQTAINSGEIL
jgi:hypothetical protein